uniref:substrate-binding domain-containing protein n=1 Tax=Rhizobium sp. RCAM05350 TaxID=2895568 RepID=UPI002076AC27|nr:substrate-binding domain-containing protein [Rhizobium sp. RCAM05350]
MAVVALDTQTDPATGVDATYETDNYRAGELIGEWARAKFARNSVEPKVAMIDVSADHITVDVQRHNGFLKGFGIAVKGPKTWEEVSDPRIVAVGVGHIALDESRSTMENLLQANPDINLVYTVNETTAFGAIQAIKAAGLSEQITVVSIDGSCAGIDALKSGMLHATVQQFPKRMAELGVVALVDYVKNGKKPTNAGGKAATDAGTVLITSDTQAGIASIDVAEGQEACF